MASPTPLSPVSGAASSTGNDIDLLPGDTVVAGVVAVSGFLATATGAAEAENGRQANRMRSRADLIGGAWVALLQR